MSKANSMANIIRLRFFSIPTGHPFDGSWNDFSPQVWHVGTALFFIVTVRQSMHTMKCGTTQSI